jgi:hypothetical protein
MPSVIRNDRLEPPKHDAVIAGVGAAFFGLCNAAVRFPGDMMRSLFGDMPPMIARPSPSASWRQDLQRP